MLLHLLVAFNSNPQSPKTCTLLRAENEFLSLSTYHTG